MAAASRETGLGAPTPARRATGGGGRGLRTRAIGLPLRRPAPPPDRYWPGDVTPPRRRPAECDVHDPRRRRRRRPLGFRPPTYDDIIKITCCRRRRRRKPSYRFSFPCRTRARVKVTDYFKTLPATPRIRSIFTTRATTINRTDRRHTVPPACPSFFFSNQPVRLVRALIRRVYRSAVTIARRVLNTR